MRFHELNTPGAYLIELEKFEDERGYFARSFCKDRFDEMGICSEFVQCNVSCNTLAGTLRGMHYQTGDESEAKLIRCTRGAAFDVIIDLRPVSPTYMQWISLLLTPDVMLYVPEHFAHGFLTLEDDTELFYQMSARFAPGSAAGIRWNDPAFNIDWPAEPTVISEKDQTYPLFEVYLR